jgi:hypothetical protein
MGPPAPTAGSVATIFNEEGVLYIRAVIKASRFKDAAVGVKAVRVCDTKAVVAVAVRSAAAAYFHDLVIFFFLLPGLLPD